MTTFRQAVYSAETIAMILSGSEQLFKSQEAALEWMRETISPKLKPTDEFTSMMRTFIVDRAKEYHDAHMSEMGRTRVLEILQPTVGFTVESVGVYDNGIPYMELTDGSTTLYVSFLNENGQWRGFPDVVDAAIAEPESHEQVSYVPTEPSTVLYFAQRLTAEGYFPSEEEATSYIQTFFQGRCTLAPHSRLSPDNQLEVLFLLDAQPTAIAN